MDIDRKYLRLFARLIAEQVAPPLLAEVLAEQGVVRNHEDLAKLGLNNAWVVELVLEVYAAQEGRIEVLVRTLIRRDPDNSKFALGVSQLLLDQLSSKPPLHPEKWKKQAAIAKRAHMLRSLELLKFLRNVEGWICVVGAELKTDDGRREVKKGTGFLVGPDLVMTARHVLGNHIVNGKANPNQKGKHCVFFDHLDGDPIGDPLDEKLPSNVRRAEFHTDWCESSSDEFQGDCTDPTDPECVAAARARLDFVLIRLAEPIGKQSRRVAGGTRRGWLDLWPATEPLLLATASERLATDERIIIPQHPNGHPQQIDFGRYIKVDASESRIRFDTETDTGTSGAPCFNHGFHLVGVHNAASESLNQAIRFDHIHRCLTQPAEVMAPRAASLLWSVSAANMPPRVILGRQPFQEWITQASTDEPAGLAQRAFVVEGTRPKSGKTFSTSILRAARRDVAERIVVLNKAENPLPQDASDFLRIIATQLGVSEAELVLIPPRPSNQLPGTADGDKLSSWCSKDLPKWFTEALGATRVHSVDAVAEAKTVVDILRSRGMEPSLADQELAESTTPKTVERSLWNKVWIVLDDVDEESVSSEVKELVACLLGVSVGAGLEESTIASEIRRLRWVFLGWRPGFLDGLLEPETLDQMKIGQDEILACVSVLVDSLDRSDRSQALVNVAMMLIAYTQQVAELKTACDDPDRRLATLQNVMQPLQAQLAAESARQGS